MTILNGSEDVSVDGNPTEIKTEDANKSENPTEWNENIDESTRERVGKFKDVNGLVKGYVDLEDRLSQGFKMPETDEEKTKLYTKLGRPSKAEDYELAEESDELGFKDIAFRLGYSQDQARGIADWFQGVIQKQTENFDEKGKATEVVLREKWVGEYEDNIALADRELTACFSESLIERLEAGGFLNDQEFILMLHNQGARKASDTIGKPGNGLDPDIKRTEAGQPFLEFPSMKEYEKGE